MKSAVAASVRQQVGAGIDVVSDGEIGKPIAFADYIADRFDGYEGQSGAFGFYNPSRRTDPFPAYSPARRGPAEGWAADDARLHRPASSRTTGGRSRTSRT